MSVDSFFPSSDARYPGVGVLDALLRWREALRRPLMLVSSTVRPVSYPVAQRFRIVVVGVEKGGVRGHHSRR